MARASDAAELANPQLAVDMLGSIPWEATSLKNMGITTLLVTGVVTNVCVHSTAREAFDYGFIPIIIEDCCAAWTSEIHRNTLNSFGLLYGFIMKLEEVMKKISKTLKKGGPETQIKN